MARSRKKPKAQPQQAALPPAKPPVQPKLSNGIMAVANTPEQKYFIDDVEPAIGALFYALGNKARLTDHEHDVKLEGVILQEASSPLDAQFLLGLTSDPANPLSVRRLVAACSKNPICTQQDCVALLSKLKVPTLHETYNLAYAKQAWQDLSAVMAANRAPTVFVVVSTPAFDASEPPELDVRIWAPMTPHRLSLAYGLEQLRLAFAS